VIQSLRLSRSTRLVIGLALALGAAGLTRSVSYAGQSHEAQTPIKHLIVVMQENHTFDSYFGTYPGADGVSPTTCMPVDPTDPSNKDCVKPFPVGKRTVVDLDHTADAFQLQFDNGRMDGFVYAFRNHGKNASAAMGYYDDRDIPYYWNLADDFVLFDRFFSSAGSGSVGNHVFWVTGTAGNFERDSVPPEGLGDLPTIFDRLEASGVSWKFYVQNYDPTITYRNRSSVGQNRSSQVVWVPLLQYPRYIDNPELFRHIVDLKEYYQDLQNGTLPSVAYLVPSGNSEHPPGSIEGGQRFVRTLINELMRSEAWNSSAFLLTYDDWGGFYDHGPPPKVDDYGYGFRVPAVLVSPYSRRGYVDHTVLDFTSILKFIEINWGLEPLASRDRQANSFASAFDFSQEPRPAGFVSTQRKVPLAPEPPITVVYIGCAAALLIPTMLILWGVLGPGARRERVKRATEVSPS
jgi:phospholipase C